MAGTMTLKRGLDLKAHGISVSQLTTWMTCRQKAKLKYHDGWKPLRPSFPMMFGSMAHAVIESAFHGLRKPPDEKWIVKEVANVVQATIEENGGRSNEYIYQQLEDSEGLLIELMFRYFQHYEDDFKKCEWQAIEDHFRFSLPGVPYEFHGVYDRVFRLNKKLWLVETKTKARIEEDNLVEVLHFDLQNLLYLNSLMHLNKETPKGVIYDILRRPGLKLKQGESKENFFARVGKDIDADPKHYFVRFEIIVEKADLDAFGQELKNIALEYIAWNEGKMPTWRNSTACVSKGMLCEFAPICGRGDTTLFMRRKG